MKTPLFWFRLLVAVGGIANLAFALPAFLYPPFLGELIDVGPIEQTVWLRNVAILLVIITTFYIPAILDPFRYLFNDYVLIVGRFSAGLFFLVLVLTAGYPGGFLVLALSDLGLSTVQALLFMFVLRDGDPRFGQPGGYLSGRARA